MASPAEWVAKSLGRHSTVARARVVRDDCVEIEQTDGDPTVTIRVVNTRVEAADIDRIGLRDVDAIVTIGPDGSYSWDAKMIAVKQGRDLYSNRELWRALGRKTFVGSESSEIEYFVDRVGGHDKVAELERIQPKLFRVHRTSGLDPLLVYCADEYMLSEDFVLNVLEEFPETQVIANLSSWNHITPEAVEEASRRGCQVWDLSGIYRALNRR